MTVSQTFGEWFDRTKGILIESTSTKGKYNIIAKNEDIPMLHASIVQIFNKLKNNDEHPITKAAKERFGNPGKV